ncbi:hypothetical protein GGI12_004138 [Dipsacomyces acuminosporus]|nr:hypothetical protein GGI12_004138 [Dipsacomyces acuminosporus]
MPGSMLATTTALLVICLLMFATGTLADFEKCKHCQPRSAHSNILRQFANGANMPFSVGHPNEWRVALKKAFIQQKHLPPPNSMSQKRVLEEELPKPYRILNPFAPYTRRRNHKRLTIYVDENNIVEDVECS